MKFVKFVLSDDVVEDYMNWLNDTYSPEENVWATINTFPWAPGGYMSEVRHHLEDARLDGMSCF
jgi:beta-1,3-galactosyl-O-glycosyl-glycoprotein beta-1,6-N-acetylglucosaminyltransferase